MQAVSMSHEQRVAAHTAAFLNGHRLPGCADGANEPAECEECAGSGEQTCEKCHGDGEIDCECSCGDEHSRECRKCDGAGTTGNCIVCHGSGELIAADDILISHPADEWTIPSLLPVSVNGSFT